MKPWHIRASIILISAAIVGLVAVQVVWLNNAIELRDSALKKNLNQALDNVVNQLEKVESLEILVEVAQESYSAKMHDSELSSTNQGSTLNFPENDFQPFTENAGEPGLQQQEQFNFYLQFIIENPADRDSSSSAFIERIVTDTSLTQSDHFMRSLIKRFQTNTNRSLSERLNTILLDSLIRNEMNLRGLDFPYQYKIIKANSGIIKMLGSNSEFEIDGKLNFASLLFPGDYISKDYYLLLTIEDVKKYQYENLLAPLLFSVLTLLLVALGVYFLISTIQKQKKLGEMKTDFINNMTHELKTPISTIALASEALIESDEGKPDGMVTRYSQMIHEENQRLKRHVERILNTSMLERGEFKLNIGRINIHALLEKLCSQTELRMKTVNGLFKREFNAKECEIEGDEMHITNIFYNVIDNAIKYSPGNLVLKIASSNSQNGIMISFEDNGIGMTVAQQKRVFEKFYRVSTGDLHAVKGFGLGLSYVKLIVEAHGGFLSLSSKLGKGSSFNIYLPFEYIEA